MSDIAELVERGRAALIVGDGAAARASFEAALEISETGEVLAGLAEAVYLDVDFPAASDLYERAFGAYQAEGGPADAARVARTLSYQNFLHGDLALMSGWLERARRLAAELDEDHPERHWVELFDAMLEPDVASRERRLRAVAETGRRIGDPNLECDALGVVGRLCVGLGRVEEGMRLLDGAMTAVRAGEVEEFVVVEGAFCLMLSACEETQDVARAEQWVRSADDIVSIRGLASLGAICRGYYGGVLMAAGRYAEAETALLEAVRGLERGYGLARASASVRLAEVRLRQGRLEEAAVMLEGFEELADAAVPSAWLHLARGQPALAVERLERALAHGAPPARPLALLVDAQLALGSTLEAAATAERLSALASEHGHPVLLAAAALARGRVCVASGESDAVSCMREAVSRFADARLPLELATARLDLARVLRTERPEVATFEAKAALETFERLGAARSVDAAAALLRDLGAPVRVGPKGTEALTKREAEVLDLLGHGLSNPEIAERLVISRKTVEHHVGRILLKLGLRNRSEAAAHAVRGSGG